MTTEPRIPAWRIANLGLYTSQDERNEEQAIAWAMMGRAAPRALAVRHMANPWHQRAWWALLMVGAWEGKATPVRVARALRRGKAWRPWCLRELLELGELGAYLANEPPWGEMVARAERRLLVLSLERETDDLRRALQSS